MATLSIERQKQIEGIVDDIKLKTGFSYPEQNLVALAKLLSVDVVEADLSQIDPNLNGATQWMDNEGKPAPTIFINSKYPAERKVFTFAHELGHFILHKGKDKLRIDLVDYSQQTPESLEESEANFFAATLLVPRLKLLQIMEVASGDMAAVAKFFGVSIPMIEARLRWLKTNDTSLV